MVLVVYTKRDQWKRKPPLTKGTKATILSLAVTNASYMAGIMAMDVSAIASRDQLTTIYGQDKVTTPHNVLYNIPVVVTVFDSIAALPTVFLANEVYRHMFNHLHNIKDTEYYCLALSTIGVIISLLNHAPYMMMAYFTDAYFTDAYYTTGMLIFYISIILSWFSLLEFVFDSWLGKTSRDYRERRCSVCKRTSACITLLLLLVLLYLGLVLCVLFYFIEIPIKPVFVAIGSFAMYKVVSKRKRLWTAENEDTQVNPKPELQTSLHQEQQPLI